MFNKNKKNKIISSIKINKFYKDNEILLTPSYITMMSKYHQAKDEQEQDIFQNDITEYVNRKLEKSVKKIYNPKIVDLYKSGYIVIDKTDYKLKDFFIVFDDNKNNFHIKCINPNFKTEEIEYNKAVRFIDTTAFTKLIKESNFSNNKIIIDNIETLNNIVNKWDGYLHSEVVETDAIINKKMIKDVACE